MAGGEDQTQEVVADRVVEPGVQRRLRTLQPVVELTAQLLVLALVQRAPAQEVDRPMLRRRHEPCPRIVRDARFRPLLQRGDERILRDILGDSDVVHDAREAGDELGGLDSPDRVDRPVGADCRHGIQSHHLRSLAQVAADAARPG